MLHWYRRLDWYCACQSWCWDSPKNRLLLIDATWCSCNHHLVLKPRSLMWKMAPSAPRHRGFWLRAVVKLLAVPYNTTCKRHNCEFVASLWTVLVPNQYEGRQRVPHGNPLAETLDIPRIWSIFSVIFVVLSFLVKPSASNAQWRMLRIDLVQLQDLQNTDVWGSYLLDFLWCCHLTDTVEKDSKRLDSKRGFAVSSKNIWGFSKSGPGLDNHFPII